MRVFRSPELPGLLAWALFSLPVSAADLSGLSIGTRLGTSASDKAESFNQYELFVRAPLPWQWNHSGWNIGTHLNAAAGVLEAGSATSAFYFSAGPSVSASRSWFFSEMGVSPTVIEKHVLGQVNLGGEFQFTSYAAVGVRVSGFSVAYRIQHMSNADIYNNNPGVDLHVLELGYRF